MRVRPQHTYRYCLKLHAFTRFVSERYLEGLVRFLASFVALYLCTSAASAAIYTYQLDDHPDGSQQANYDYGLRLDGPGLFYTFQLGNAFLTYDDIALTASITGTVNQSTPVDQTSPVDTSILYTLSGIVDAGGGFFTATGGSGNVGGLALTGKQAMSGPASGLAFLFLNDGHRLPGSSGISGRGWIDYPGTNDFLFTASPVPLPAAFWLFGSALIGLIGYNRRRKTA